MAAVVDHLGERFVILGFAHNSFDGFLHVDGQENDVGTGAEGFDGTLAVLVASGNGLHINAIGEDESVEIHLLSQDWSHDAFGE